jgi:hypothetical protein
MALPPNRFKLLLCGSYEEIYERLRVHGCLSDEGLRKKAHVLNIMEKVSREHHAWVRSHPGWTGPSGSDRLEAALLSSPYVTQRARELAEQNA